MKEKINIGIVGAGGRGGSIIEPLSDAFPAARVHAICDSDADCLPDVKRRLGASESYVDFIEMVEKSHIDALLMGTPMNFHAPHAIEALKRGIHVLSEVPAGVTVGECRQLAAACAESDAIYMMAENYIFTRPNIIVRELSRAGLFGTPYYAEGEYIHELKAMNEKTPWRRIWQTGINGITYGTHSLGPVLQWLGDERVSSVCCAGSGHHYIDSRGVRYENEESCVMLCKTSRGNLVKIRVDMLSDRPHAMTNYQLQGTDGCYEAARAEGESNRLWLRSINEGQKWSDLDDMQAAYLPEWYQRASEEAERSGHGGGDFFVLKEFIDSICCGRKPLVDIHAAMDMTLPGLISQESIQHDGKWMTVPDSRKWIE